MDFVTVLEEEELEEEEEPEDLLELDGGTCFFYLFYTVFRCIFLTVTIFLVLPFPLPFLELDPFF